MSAKNKYEAYRIAQNKTDMSIVSVKALLFDFSGFRFEHKISTKELVTTAEQIAILTRVGISFIQSLKEVKNTTQNKKLQATLEAVISDINNGMSISIAVKKQRQALGDEFVSMSELGETTGDIAYAMTRIATLLGRRAKISAKLQKVTLYPLITIISSIIAFFIIMTTIVPKFEAIFYRFKIDLPFFTKVLLGFEHFFISYGAAILLFISVFISFVIVRYKSNDESRIKIDKMLLTVPVMGGIVKLAEVGKFSIALSVLAGAGISIVKSIEIAIKSLGNSYLKAQLISAVESMRQGIGFGEALKSANIYDSLSFGLIAAGEKSGELVGMFEKIGKYYEDSFDSKIETIASLLEPIIILLMGCIVCILALGVFMPLWDVSALIRR